MLSIIIPTLNEEKFLSALLKSIKKQDFEDYEIIVADNNSKDKTREIALKFGCRISKGGLPGKARNEGAKIARGDLFLFLDADLIIPPNFLSSSLKEFKERKLGIASYCLVPMTGKKMIKRGFNLFWNLPIKVSENILANGAMGILVKQDIFKKVGGFDENIKLAEDHYFVRSAAKIGKFGVIKSTEIYITLRRFETDGYFNTLSKYLLCYLYMFSGKAVKSDIFNYRFGHYSKDGKNKL